MFLDKVKSEGIAHLSYILGDGNHAAVIDPRRDCAIYQEIAARNGVSIRYIFETHRNEDYVIGSQDLARRTGARIYHGSALDFFYGEAVREGDRFMLGELELKILETPGHTLESISLVLTDKSTEGDAVAVFTGDALFVGDVGRTDFYPDRAEEVAGALYDSIFKKLLPLGDQAIIYPAHGAGSVCGDSMSAREFSTLGHERLHNPALQVDSRDQFIRRKLSESHPRPTYFKMMERYNLEGAPPLEFVPEPTPLNLDQVDQQLQRGALLLDLRSPEAFAGAFIPGSLAIPLDMVPAYAGYLIGYDRGLVLTAETYQQVALAVRYLIRMGYDRIAGYLSGGMTAWEVSGRPYDRIVAVHAETLDRRLRNHEDFTLLDVRKKSEIEEGRLAGATHIFLGDLPERWQELDRDKPVVTFCGSGKRAIIAASILKQNGFKQVEDSLGSMAACRQVGCVIED